MDKRDVRTLRTNFADYSSNNHLAKRDNLMLVEQEDDETVTAFKRSGTGEILTKQQRMQRDIAEFSKIIIRSDPRTKFEPDLPAPLKVGKIGTETSRKPTGKARIQTLSKRVENMM